MKTFKAYIIVDEKDRAALWDGRPQIYWLKKVAVIRLKEFGGHQHKIVRCEITAPV